MVRIVGKVRGGERGGISQSESWSSDMMSQASSKVSMSFFRWGRGRTQEIVGLIGWLRMVMVGQGLITVMCCMGGGLFHRE